MATRAAVRVRPLTAEEVEAIRRRLRAAGTAQRLAERAHIVWLAHQGWAVPTIARWAAVTQPTVRTWLKRFNAAGLAGLRDAPRVGRPPTSTAAELSEVIALSLTDPRSLGLPFGAWTLDRLAAYLSEEKGIPIKRTRINEILLAEHLRWRQQETWFGERVDPRFAEKRGPSSASTPLRRSAV